MEGSATQGSNFENNHFAKYAIDGNFTTDLIHLGQCTHTNKDAGAWWQVEFTDIYTIQKVAITTRKGSGKTLIIKIAEMICRGCREITRILIRCHHKDC